MVAILKSPPVTSIKSNRHVRSESIDSLSSSPTIDVNVKNIQNTPAFIIELHSTSCPKVESLLSAYNGHLIDVGSHLIDGLRKTAPQQLAARVGDYNQNLFYEMQDKDISGIIRTEMQNDEELLQDDIEAFEASISSSLQHTSLTYRGSFMRTESTMYQPAHVDYDYPILEKFGNKLFLAFFPLTEEGAYLQLWQEPSEENANKRKLVEGTVVFIPCGKMLIVPSDTIHGGGFKRGSSGNLRFHLYIELEEADERKDDNITLLDHPMNKYTEQHDQRRELCERFVDAEGLESLLDVYFDVHPEAGAIGSWTKSLKIDFDDTITGDTKKSASYVNLFGLSEEGM
jgi:hypothetical protein